MLISAARTPADLAAMVDRRAAGLPLEHVLGWAEFCGLRIVVDPGVFVPRRRTEFLVRQAAALTRPRAVVVDLCCGSGAVGVALVAALDRVELYAVDIDPAAVRCARPNLAADDQDETASCAATVPELDVEDLDFENRCARVTVEGGDVEWIVSGTGPPGAPALPPRGRQARTAVPVRPPDRAHPDARPRRAATCA